jgi:O-antigen ligase
MAAHNAPLISKGRGWPASLGQGIGILAFLFRWLALGALLLTILLLCDWRPVYLHLAIPFRLLDPKVLPPQVLAPNGKYLPLYPSDFGALATLLLWLLAWVAGRLSALFAPSASVGKLPTLQARAFALRIAAPLAGLAGLAALSETQAVAPMLALKIALHLVLLLGFVLALRNLRPPAWVMVAPLALLLAAQGMLALMQAWAQSTLIGQLLFHWGFEATANQIGASVIQLGDGSRWLRAYGTFPHPNILGGFLCLALPVVAGAARRLPWRNRVAWLLRGAAALGLVALVLCFSRGAWLGIVGAEVWAWLARRQLAIKIAPMGLRPRNPPARVSFRRWRSMALLALPALVLMVVVELGPLLQSRLLLNAVPLEQRSVDERVILLEASAVFISQHPLLGVGAGNMPLVERSYPPTSAIAQPAHNVPLAVGVETGLIGLLLWLIPPISLLWGVWRVRKEPLEAGGRAWALTSSAALVAVLIAAQFDHYFWSQPIGRLMYWLTIGLCSVFALRSAAIRQP